MSTQIPGLEAYSQDALDQTVRGTFARLRVVCTSRLFVVPKDEPRPIADLLYWDTRRRPRTSAADRKRTRFWKHDRYDVYWVPMPVAKVLDTPDWSKDTPDPSCPPSYESVCKASGGNGKGGQVRPPPPPYSASASALAAGPSHKSRRDPRKLRMPLGSRSWPQKQLSAVTP